MSRHRNDPSPGTVLRHALAEKRWDQRTLARILGRPVQVVNEIADDKKAITAISETGWTRWSASARGSETLRASRDSTLASYVFDA